MTFKATDRLVGALNLLEESKTTRTSKEDLKQITENLSWLRTEMKYEVGAYSRREAEMKLPNIKLKEAEEERAKEEAEAAKAPKT